MDSLTAGRFVPARHIPDLDRGIAASRNQALAVGAERQAHDHAGVAAQPVPPLQGCRVPEGNRGVLARGGEPAAVRAERHRVDIPGVAVEGAQQAPGLGVPDLDGVLLGCRDQALAVRTERRAVPLANEAHGKREKGLLGLPQPRWIPAPELGGPVVARRHEALAVGAERQAPDVLAVPADDADFLASFRVPNLYCMILPLLDGLAVDLVHEDIAAVGTARHAVWRLLGCTEGAEFHAGGR